MNKKTKNYLLIGIITIIIILASFLRLWKLNQIPPGVWYDEAYNGLDAISALENHHYQIFYPENYGREGLFINIIAISFKFFGVNNFALRLPSALIGILTIIGFYFLLKSLSLYRTTIVLGIFSLATSFYYLNFSRISFRAIMVPFFLVWSLYFFMKGYNLIRFEKQKNQLKKYKCHSLAFFFFSGLLTGLGLHTYIAYRIVPLIFIIILISLIISQKNIIQKYWKGILLFLLGAMISAGPLLLYFKENPSTFSGRTNAVSIFNAPNQSTLQAFWQSLTIHLQSIIFIGDGNQRHNYNSFPLLPAVWSLFFFIGFLTSLEEIFKTFLNRFKNKPPTKLFMPSLVGQATFWAMLIPGIFSMEGIPHFLRIIGITPAIFLITILPFEKLRKLYIHLKTSSFYSLKLWRWRIMQVSFIILISIFFITGIFQIYLYFQFWSKSPKTADAFQNDLFQFGQIIKKEPLKKQNYLLLNNKISINKTTRSDLSEKTLLFSGYPNIQKYQFYNINETDLILEDRSLDCSNAQFILQPDNPLLSLKKINNYCRNLNLQQITLDKNTPTKKVWILR